MTLIEQIKQKQIVARKAGSAEASLLTTLLGEAELWRLKQKSTCKFSIENFAVEKFDDISSIRNEEGFVRFVSSEFNEYFGVKE